MKELLIGCGANRSKRIALPEHKEWEDLTTLDMNAAHKPDILWDLNILPYKFAMDNEYDEIHAYEVLEHTGQQGDWKFFFSQFNEFYRILKPDGHIYGTSPSTGSPWLWGDPGHTRSISRECFVFLSQPQYTQQVGQTAMTDYRFVYSGDFDLVMSQVIPGDGTLIYGLKAIKPSRSTYETGSA